MAKVKSGDDAEKDLFTQLKDSAVSTFGKNAPENVSDIPYRISTGVTLLDLAIHKDGRGLPGGRTIEIFGKFGNSKSLLALSICRQVQAKGGYAVYLDPERAMTDDMLGFMGVNPEAGWLYRMPESAEQCLSGISSFLNVVRKGTDKDNVRPVVLVVDSVAAMVPESVQNKKLEDVAPIAALARLLSRFLPEGGRMISGMNVYLIFLNQVRANMKGGGFGSDPDTTVGGVALGFYTSVRIKLTRVETTKYKSGPYMGQERGMLIEAQVHKSRLGPSRRKILYPVYTHASEPVMGISDGESIFNYLLSRDVIKNIKSKYCLADDLIFSRAEFVEKFEVDANWATHVRNLTRETYREEYGDTLE